MKLSKGKVFSVILSMSFIAGSIVVPVCSAENTFDYNNVLYQEAAVDAHSNVAKIIKFFRGEPFNRMSQEDNNSGEDKIMKVMISTDDDMKEKVLQNYYWFCNTFSFSLRKIALFPGERVPSKFNKTEAKPYLGCDGFEIN